MSKLEDFIMQQSKEKKNKKQEAEEAAEKFRIFFKIIQDLWLKKYETKGYISFDTYTGNEINSLDEVRLLKLDLKLKFLNGLIVHLSPRITSNTDITCEMNMEIADRNNQDVKAKYFTFKGNNWITEKKIMLDGQIFEDELFDFLEMNGLTE